MINELNRDKDLASIQNHLKALEDLGLPGHHLPLHSP